MAIALLPLLNSTNLSIQIQRVICLLLRFTVYSICHHGIGVQGTKHILHFWRIGAVPRCARSVLFGGRARKPTRLVPTADLLDLIPSERQASIVEVMEELSSLLDPENQVFQEVLRKCREQGECCAQEEKRRWTMRDLRDNEVRQAVRKAYGDMAKAGSQDVAVSLHYVMVK